MGKIKNFFENRWDDLMLTVSSVTTRRKILDVILGWLMWYFIIWLLCLLTPDELAQQFFPHINYARSGFKWMVAFYPVNLYLFHGVSVESDKEVQEAYARAEGKRFYTYRPHVDHVHGGFRLYLLFAVWFVVIGVADEILPKFLWNIFICIPIAICFLPEIKIMCGGIMDILKKH